MLWRSVGLFVVRFYSGRFSDNRSEQLENGKVKARTECSWLDWAEFEATFGDTQGNAPNKDFVDRFKVAPLTEVGVAAAMRARRTEVKVPMNSSSH